MQPSDAHRNIREAVSASRTTAERQQPPGVAPEPSTAAVHNVIEALELDAAHERHILQLIGAAIARKKKQHAGVSTNLFGYKLSTDPAKVIEYRTMFIFDIVLVHVD